MGQQEDLVAGRYRLLNLIGSGGMGYVWLAWDERLSRAVALKQLRSLVDLPEAEAEVAHQRAMREARITARLHHRNAVPVFDVVDHEGSPCLVMQYVPSRSLHEILATEGTLPVREVAAIGAGVAAALATAHEAGIVHRDVKPGNILIANDGTPLLTDFGISRAYGDASLTSTGMLTGTPAYLAPEVARGAASTPAADVFSLGSTLYAAVEGSPPFGAAENPIALLHQVASEAVVPPRRAGSLTRVLMWMLAAEPGERPTMEQAAKALDAVAAGAGDTMPLDVVPPSAGPAASLAADPDADEAQGGHTAVLPVEPLPGTGAQPRPQPQAASGGLRGSPPEAVQPAPAPAPTAPAPTAATAHGSAAAALPPEEPMDDGSPVRRRATAVLLGAALLMVLGVLAVFLLNRGGDAPTAVAPSISGSRSGPAGSSTARSTESVGGSTTATPRPSSTVPTQTVPKATSRTAAPPSAKAPTTGSAAPEGAAAASELAGAVRDYYARLPEDTDAGWARLTQRYRTTTATSRQTYERFWEAVSSVQASDVAASSPASVVATLRYDYKDGRSFIERTAFTWSGW